MDVKVKTENAKGASITEVGSSSVRDGEVGSGTEDQPKKKVESPDGDTEIEWTEDDFILSVEYFAKECLLPNEGLMPGDITKSLVSDEEVEKCFGSRTGRNGRNGPKLNNCVGLPQSKVLHIFQVIDGHDKPVNGTLGAIFPRALYAERFMKKCINWAAYAHERHKNQIRTCKSRGDSKPTGPPVVHPLRVYKPPANLSLEPSVSDDRASPKEKPKLQPTETCTVAEQAEEPGASVMDGSSGEAPQSRVKSEVRAVKMISSATYMPGFLELKDDIAIREKRIAELQADVTAQTEAIADCRRNLNSADESIVNTESSFKAHIADREKLESERTALAEKKQTLEIRLDDGGFDEDNPEDMNLLQSLELEEEELNLKFSEVLLALKNCTDRLVRSQVELKSHIEKVLELKGQINTAETQIEKAEKKITKEESMVEGQIEELKRLSPFAESPMAVLSPRFIPTATEVTRTIFRLSSCPVCCLGFHCMNFMPTPCGHSYHPACLAAHVAHSRLHCLACAEQFHPHWCDAWGIGTTEELRQEWENKVDLQKQHDAFRECIKDIYLQMPHLLSERRIIEAEKRHCLNVKYTEVGVERAWQVSSAATKVRGCSPCNTVVSTREESRENEVICGGTNHIPRTRSRAGKRVAPKIDVVRKVRTRSYVTEAEISTGIGSPKPYTKVVVKPLGDIETPEALKRTGVLPSSCNKSKRKIFI